MFPSPQVDWGYDVSDYYNVNPEYGQLKDMDKLLARAKQRKIRVLLDFVLTYTSDQNKWFQESRSSLTNPKSDWYIWQDGKGRSSLRTIGLRILAGLHGSTTFRPASGTTIIFIRRSPT